MTTLASVFTDVWDHLSERDRQYLFLVLVGFLASFGFIRLSTRLMRSPKVPWWPGSVETKGGVHVHHLVFGIVAMMAAGAFGFAIPETEAPWYGLWAVVFGIGMGLTLDEYALWVHLKDVYWTREGRSSIDAALIALTFIGILLLAAFPDDISTENLDAFAITSATAAVHVSYIAIALSKGRLGNALVGTFIPGPALYAAIRLGKPDSLWARRFYGDRNPGKQARAEHRFRPDRMTNRVRERVRDAIGGVTEEEYQARLAAATTPVNPSRDER